MLKENLDDVGVSTNGRTHQWCVNHPPVVEKCVVVDVASVDISACSDFAAASFSVAVHYGFNQGIVSLYLRLRAIIAWYRARVRLCD